MQRSNFHTHTVYSDGHDTVREMIETAIEKGFHSLGFSDHSWMKYDSTWGMSEEGMWENYRDIRRAQEEYKGKFNVYCGLELDGETERPEYWDIEYDYLLSSVHSVLRRGVILPIDSSGDEQRQIVSELCGGDWMEFAKIYYADLTDHVCRNKTDIVGHFDLVTKYGLMPEDTDAYINYSLEAIREIMKYCRTFELNTGAIARGLRTVPYPASFQLDEIKKLGGRIVITSDCHYRAKLDYWFDEAEKYLADHGFRLNENGVLNDKVRGIEIWE